MRSAFGKVVKAGYYCYTDADNTGYAEAGSRTRTKEFFQGGIGVMETPPDRRDFRKNGGLFTSITPIAGSRGEAKPLQSPRIEALIFI